MLGVMASCKYIIKKPADCLLAELFHFYLLLKKGNKVSTKDLSQKIHNCEFLAFCYLENRLVGISAIKRPAKSYIEEVHRKAGVWRNIEEYIFEVGYSFTEDDVRRLGISGTLKQMLQEKIIHHHGMVFSTTAVQTSQRFLKSQGFVACGNPYQGKYDDNIIYFEKRI
ncbi:hypothetical protein GCM10008119_28240 [Pedobacter mendelii]|uniref:N-acetyltransferase domain-containing protein n=2 Tax=Pedobacter mendelii TaxID=1908240 RepID=A0ABQ2BNA3_9SPHI|nr:hypothetical protein GCM10008119_28240 [Pedobacter mendelii]